MKSMDMFSKLEEKLVIRASMMKQPINGIMELTPLCNMNCDMCYVRLSKPEMEAQGRLLTGEEWLSMGQQMARHGTLFLLLTGGEPLLHPDFKQIYLGLKKLGMILTINTNGTLFNEEWVKFFSLNKPRRINVTLYGADEDTYASLCHYPGGFGKTINAIKMLRENGVDVKLNGSITPSNRNNVDRIIRIANELDVPYKLDTYMYPATRERGSTYDQQARLSPEEAAQVNIRIKSTGKTKQEFSKSARDFLEKLKDSSKFPGRKVACRAGSSSFMINWQGQMRPCIMVNQPTVSVLTLGFVEAWKQIVDETSKIRLSAQCSGCDLRGVCQVCAACALLETGNYSGTPEYMCRYTKESLRLLKQTVEEDAHE